jgi:hypothetical protein
MSDEPEHFPEKWTPVFRKEMRQGSNPERFPGHGPSASHGQAKREALWPRAGLPITALLHRRAAGEVASSGCRNRHRQPWRGIMKFTTSAALAATLGVLTASVVTLQVRAGGDKIAFPDNYDKGVMYFSLDRPDTKQYRDIYVTPAAIDALKKGEPAPSGTVITTVIYKAKLDGDGNPVKDAGGRYIKTDLAAYAVMEKRTGWGTEYPPEKRNGEWEYQVFTAERKVNDKANLGACFDCHKPHADTDFLFTADKIKAAAR